MKYVSFRITTTRINKKGTVESGWFVEGQRETDLNWSFLKEAETEEEAKDLAKGYRVTNGLHFNSPIYNPSGYAYEHNGQML